MKKRSKIGQFLARWRIDEQMSQREMAALLGVSPAYLSAVERGKKGLGAEFAAKICGLPEMSGYERQTVLEIYLRPKLELFGVSDATLVGLSAMIASEATFCQ